jgi:hypothetical protein
MCKFTRRIVVLLVLGAAAAAGLAPVVPVGVAAAANPARSGGFYSPVNPTRVCDTRAGNPSKLSGHAAQCLNRRIKTTTPLDLSVTGFFKNVSNPTAVVLNVTAVNPAASGHLTVYPKGQPLPTSWSLNVTPRSLVANMVQVAVGTGGDILIYASTASDVVVDVQGYFSPTPLRGTGSGLYQALPMSKRVCDTRPNNPSGLTGLGAQCNRLKLAAGGHIAITVAAKNAFGVLPGAIAVVANVTAVAGAGAGFLTVYADGAARPATPNVNYVANQLIPNRVTATLSTSGKIDVYSSQTTNVFVDISGYYTGPSGTLAGAIFTPQPDPLRVCDTRAGNLSHLSGPAAQCNGLNNGGMPLGPNKTLTVQIGGQFGVPDGAMAVAVNVTAAKPTTSTQVTVYQGGSRPLALDLNPPVNGLEANLVVAKLSKTGSFSIYNRAGTVNVFVDLVGWYLDAPAPPTGLTAVPGLSRVDLSWTEPVSPGASPIKGYNVYEGLSAGGESSSPLNGCILVTNFNCPVAGLASGTTYYFTVKAVNALGSSVASETSATPGPPLTWSSAGSAEPPVEEWNAISCPTSGFCAAVGGARGDVAVYRNGAWSAPSHIVPNSNPAAILGLVSCSSSTFCVAVDQGTQSLFGFDGTNWPRDATSPSTSPITEVSCGAGGSFCMLADTSGNTFTSTDGATWTAGGAFPANTTLMALSCLSSTSCLALLLDFDPVSEVTTGYNVGLWDGTGWSAGVSLPSTVVTDNDTAGGFSCSSSTQCVSLFADGLASTNVLYTYDGAAWSQATLPGGYTPVFNNAPRSPLSCVQGSACFVMGLNATAADLFTYSGASWSAVPNGATGGVQAVPRPMSCGSATLCAALIGDNNVEVFDSSVSPGWKLTPVGGTTVVQAVSCATPAFCLAVDDGANYRAFDGTSWSTPTTVKDSADGAFAFSGPNAITCPAAGSCAAIDGHNNVWRYAGGTWSMEQAMLPPTFGHGGISCTTTGFCAAVSGGEASTYDPANKTWTLSSSPDPSNKNLDSVSCLSSSFCVAVDQSGFFTTLTGTGWSQMSAFDTSASAASTQSVSCMSATILPATTLCVASGDDGNAEIYTGTTGSWSSPSALDGGVLSNPSCVQATTIRPAFCAVSGLSNMYYMENEGGIPTWTGAQTVPDNNKDLVNSLGCGTSLCIATGAQNHAWKGTP